MNLTLVSLRIHTQKQKIEFTLKNENLKKSIILRGVRQGDPIFPKLFTAAIQEVFKNSELESRGIDIGAEKINDLRFADDVALTTSTVEDMEVH